jgi:hypothetical protein
MINAGVEGEGTPQLMKRALRAGVALLVASSGARALEVRTGSENVTLQIDPLIQARAEVDFDGLPGAAAPDGDANFDFFIRRARVLFRGTVYRQFEFGVNIVAIRIGERGNLNVSPFLQDLRIAYVPVKDVNFEIGLLIMPLSHAAVEGAGFQSSIEGPGAILLYNNARQLRETGIQVRALLLDRRIFVRGGLYEGARNTNPPAQPALNPNGMPLAGGMIRLNLADDETAYAFHGIYLDGKTRISVGVGGQYQPHSGGLRSGSTSYDDYRALAADLFADVALPRDMEAILMVAGYRFDYGTGNARTGYGMHAEAGYRWGLVEPQGTFYWFNSDTKQNSHLKIAGGVNLFLHGHNAKIQTEFASVISNANLRTTPALHQVVVQIQLAF